MLFTLFFSLFGSLLQVAQVAPESTPVVPVSENAEKKSYVCSQDSQCFMRKNTQLQQQVCVHEDQLTLSHIVDIPPEERMTGGACACIVTLCDMVGSGYYGMTEEGKKEHNKQFCEASGPVCGEDGKTYKNSCEAVNRARVNVVKAGPC